MDRWPDRMGFFANPVWEQVPGHPGWMTFNELYADASAAAWLLAASDHDPQAGELIEAVTTYREQQSFLALQHGYPHMHDTAGALQAIVRSGAVLDRAPAQRIEAAVRSVATNAFEDWLAQGGQRICEKFVEQALAGRGLKPVGLLGLQAPQHDPFLPVARREDATQALARRTPDHPIFKFTQRTTGRLRVSAI